ncbi:alpha-tocopherol transfer protein-like [Rhipicephalus sanguineus]|uniref:alpha-tocopherol transfer protein-like n=1 Tax=Rhipicephalus sanguineus TaxID=34632 RepID=UPI0018951F0F|nr:alpha-tocopherol transfer protein-like [Rhipicephalus sanguineus]
MSAATLKSAGSLESIEDVAFRELGETPAIKQTALNQLRQLIISDELSLHCPMDDAFLVKFLRARKYDTQAAFKNVKKYFKVRKDRPEMFKDLTPSSVPFDVVCRKHRLTTVSRHRDPMGRMAMLMKAGAWNTEICSVNDYFRLNLVLLEHFLRQEDVQVRGIVLVFDLEGLNIYHLAHYTPSVIRTLIRFAQIRLFGYDLKELHQLVPDDVIPEEHGGTNESYDYDQLERELESEEGFFQNLSSYGYRDTSRKTEPESNSELTDS